MLAIRSFDTTPATAIATEVETQPHDLVILGGPSSQRLPTAETVLKFGGHHVLLLPVAGAVPAGALICVANGEPGKEDVLFAGRLLRHFGAKATLLTVLSPASSSARASDHGRAHRFLEDGVRTLSLLGVAATTAVRTGAAAEQIQRELQTGEYDLLVLGAPLPDIDGKIALDGLIGRILRSVTDQAILIVRANGQTNAPVRVHMARKPGAENRR